MRGYIAIIGLVVLYEIMRWAISGIIMDIKLLKKQYQANRDDK